MSYIDSAPFFDHPDPVIANLVCEFLRARANPRTFLRTGTTNAPLEPFLIEGCAAGLIDERLTCVQAIALVQRVYPKVYAPLIICGCGVGASKKSIRELDYDRLDDSERNYFLEGLGFAITLETTFNPTFRFALPQDLDREPIIRGCGRAVTFLPTRNTVDKYARAFARFVLTPDDRKPYYSGVGFSLEFTGADFPHDAASFGADEPYVRHGREAARILRDSFPVINSNTEWLHGGTQSESGPVF